MQKQLAKPIGIFGGTFDPVHHGHLRTALELYQRLDWQQVRFIPCQQPVLDKKAMASPAQRVAMLQLAIVKQAGFVVDERELKRTTPSYTIDTLISLRQEFPATPLCLVIGFDNLLNLSRWHRWQELLDYAHIVINSRPFYELPATGVIAELIKKHRVQDEKLLHQQLAGLVYYAQLTPLAISATAIREDYIAQGLSPRYLLPDAVWEYIQREKLYQINIEKK